MTQILQNGATSTYYNLLTVDSGPYALTGDYSCEVSNTLGTATVNISVEGILLLIACTRENSSQQLPTYICLLGLATWQSSDVFTLGESASISCSSDLDVVSIKWLHNNIVVRYSSESELQLIFDSVNDTIHNEEFICRVTSSYGIQEQSIRPFVQSKQ